MDDDGKYTPSVKDGSTPALRREKSIDAWTRSVYLHRDPKSCRKCRGFRRAPTRSRPRVAEEASRMRELHSRGRPTHRSRSPQRGARRLTNRYGKTVPMEPNAG